MLIACNKKAVSVLKMVKIAHLETRPLINTGKKTCFKIMVSCVGEMRISEFPEQKVRKIMSKGKTFFSQETFFLTRILLNLRPDFS